MPFCFVHCAFLWHCSHWCLKTQPLVCLKYFCVWGIAVFICLCVFLWPCRHWLVKALSLVWKGTGTYSHCHCYVNISCVKALPLVCTGSCLLCTSVALQTLLHLSHWCVSSISVSEVLPCTSVGVYVCGIADIAVSGAMVCLKYFCVWGIAVNICVCVRFWQCRHCCIWVIGVYQVCPRLRYCREYPCVCISVALQALVCKCTVIGV